MGDHDQRGEGTRVTSSIHGGCATSIDLDHLTDVVNALAEAGRVVEGMNRSWNDLAGDARRTAWMTSLCTAAVFSATVADGAAAATHDPHAMRALGDACDALPTHYAGMGTALESLADRASRAHSLYSQAEDTTASLLTRTVELGGMLLPKQMAIGFLAWAGASVAVGSIKEGRLNPHHAFHGTDAAQEGVLSALGTLISSGGRGNVGKAVMDDDSVNEAATVISRITKPLSALVSGGRLEVTEVRPHAGDIGPARNIGEAMRHMDGIADGTTVPYGTVALQEYRRADGTRSWLLTVPGTDNEWDTAIGWMQNVELMSADNDVRMGADSARLAVEALERAGVAPDEPIAIVGHSQGGIVAGTLAAGLEGRYNVSHIVTAGSPIANHPIPESTYVTSIETTGELVSNLDGRRNPARDSWLTIRGEVHEPGASVQGTTVEGASEHRELAHGRNYMHAAYEDADRLGSEALREHQAHFEQIVDGEYMGTRYYQGRTRHPWE